MLASSSRTYSLQNCEGKFLFFKPASLCTLLWQPELTVLENQCSYFFPWNVLSVSSLPLVPLPPASLTWFLKNIMSKGFPGGAVVENLLANAGDTGSSPDLGRSHMPQSGWAREPQLLSLRVWSLCSTTREAAIVRGPRTAMKSGPRLPQLEKALAKKRRPNTAINNK